MTLALALAVLAASAPTPASTAPAPPAPLEQLVSLLVEKEWDEAFLLIPQVAPPVPPTAASRSAAQSIAKSAAECRAVDAAMALAFSALAARLAPDEPAVLIAHAGALLALAQRGEAAGVLDRVVKEHPAKDGGEARLLRAGLANEEGDFQLTVELLTPLLEQPSFLDRAKPLLGTARAELELRKVSSEAVPAARPPASSNQAGAGAKAAPRHPAGTVVATFPDSVRLRGSRTLVVTKLSRGQTYLFLASGTCSRANQQVAVPCQPPMRGSCGTQNIGPKRSDATVDFRVRFGSQDASRSLAVGQRGARDLNKVDFVAEGTEQTIEVFDDSDQVEPDVSCTMSEFSVVAQ